MQASRGFKAVACQLLHARALPADLRCMLWLAGAEKVFPLGDLSDYEKEGLKAAIPELKSSIDKGVEFGKSG